MRTTQGDALRREISNNFGVFRGGLQSARLCILHTQDLMDECTQGVETRKLNTRKIKGWAERAEMRYGRSMAERYISDMTINPHFGRQEELESGKI